MGTAAFGSLIIAVVMFVRSVVLYLEKKIKEFENNAVSIMLIISTSFFILFFS